MAATVRFVQAPPPPPEPGMTALLPESVTILDIAPCLADTGKRLLDAGELYQLFLAMLNGVFPFPVTAFGSAFIMTGAGNLVIPQGINYVPVRQSVPEAINITLPEHVAIGYSVLVKDSLGVCTRNNFTIITADGTLIDERPTFVMRTSFQAQIFVFDGTEWGVTG